MSPNMGLHSQNIHKMIVGSSAILNFISVVVFKRENKNTYQGAEDSPETLRCLPTLEQLISLSGEPELERPDP